jgi:phosphatidyl-myo-inositol alpha-mannosyltransferase
MGNIKINQNCQYMKKHIIISNYDDLNNPYYSGGGAGAIAEIASRLARIYDINLISGAYPGSINHKADGILYRHIGIPFAGAKIGQLIYNLYLIFYAAFSKYDLWIESFTPPFSISLLPFFVKKPLIGSVHMLSGADMERKYHLPFTVIENLGLGWYRNFITTTPKITVDIQKNNPQSQVRMIPNGVTPYRQSQKNLKQTTIVYLGRIEVNQKGLDLLISAFAQIHIQNLTLIIAGSGNETDVNLLNNLISKTAHSNKIKVIGRVDDEKKRELFKKASMIVLPSRFETFSIVALEALANRIPLVTFDIPGLEWIPKNIRVVAKSQNAYELKKAITELIDNQKLQQELKISGYKFSKNYDWDKLAYAYKTFIDSLIN